MRIPSRDIPQADRLADVVATVVAVSKGADSFQKIAEALGKVERQGRYYRRAAVILGFIANENNRSILTNLGKEFLKAGANLENPILKKAVLNIRIIQRLLAYLETHRDGIANDRLVTYLGNITEDTGPTMLPRRLHTLSSWLQSLNLIEMMHERYRVNPTITEELSVLDFSHVDEPILPRTGELSEYEKVRDRCSKASDEIVILKDGAAVDRANSAHQHLVDLVAERIRSSGCLPRNNAYIDLAARLEDHDYIFEIKSITADNIRGQVRKGISQLYEYRYLQDLLGANLVLVLENYLPPSSQWMHQYLEDDRHILLLWDGNRELYSTPETMEKLSFLW